VDLGDVDLVARVGAEDEVIARLTAAPGDDPSLPDAEHRRFGDVAAVWGCWPGWTRSR
jgi:hypothetical protein